MVTSRAANSEVIAGSLNSKATDYGRMYVDLRSPYKETGTWGTACDSLVPSRRMSAVGSDQSTHDILADGMKELVGNHSPQNGRGCSIGHPCTLPYDSCLQVRRRVSLSLDSDAR